MEDVLSDLAHQERRLSGSVRSRFGLCREYLQTILASSAFRNPLLSVMNREQHLDDLAWGLGDAMRAILIQAEKRMQEYQQQVARIEPHRLLGRMTVELNELKGRGLAAVTRVLSGKILAITAGENRLAALNPKSVLNRGYGITMNKQTGQVVRSIDDIQIDDLLVTELARENVIESRVTGKARQDRPDVPQDGGPQNTGRLDASD